MPSNVYYYLLNIIIECNENYNWDEGTHSGGRTLGTIWGTVLGEGNGEAVHTIREISKVVRTKGPFLLLLLMVATTSPRPPDFLSSCTSYLPTRRRPNDNDPVVVLVNANHEMRKFCLQQQLLIIIIIVVLYLQFICEEIVE